MKAWIECMESDILYLRTFSDRPEMVDDDTWAEMLQTCDFWKAIDADEEYIQRNISPTRSHGDPILSGHWELVSSSTETEIFDSIPNLTQTTWHQEPPFNQFCPYKSNSNYVHSDGGCSAVAAAQMEYFLHYKIGFPVYAPTDAFCTANVNNYNSSNYYTFGSSSTIWDTMENDTNAATQNATGEAHAAVLISDAGIGIGVNYTDNGSGAGENDVVDYFNSIGISCTQNDYVPSTVCSSLLSGMPVVLSAKREKKTVLGYTYYLHGHYFIAHGYKRLRQTTTNTYEWVYEFPNAGPISIVEDSIEIIYHSPFICGISMNWGAGDTAMNRRYFSLTGDWAVDSTHNYQYKRKMITGYSH